MDMTTVRELNHRVEREALFVNDLLNEINKVMVGQEKLVERVLIALLADGHILLEGVPGLAKTLLVKTTAEAISVLFNSGILAQSFGNGAVGGAELARSLVGALAKEGVDDVKVLREYVETVAKGRSGEWKEFYKAAKQSTVV